MIKKILILGIVCGLSGIGLFMLLADLFRLPFRRTSKAFLSARRREEKRGRESAADVRFGKLALALSKKIRLNPIKKSVLESSLSASGEKRSAEEHVARALVKAAVFALPALPMLLIFPAFAPVFPALAIGVYFKEYSAPERRVAAVREEIEYELPMLVSRIQSMLSHTRDVVAILDSYRKNAGRELARELSVTVADMQSGNGREALARLETRVGSPALSDIARGLASVMEGNNPEGYWTSLAIRLNDRRRQSLMRRVHAVPAKISRLSLALLACIVLIYGTVICTELFTSLGVMF